MQCVTFLGPSPGFYDALGDSSVHASRGPPQAHLCLSPRLLQDSGLGQVHPRGMEEFMTLGTNSTAEAEESESKCLGLL